MLSLIIAGAGASGIIAQILLLRQLLISFSGNELSIGAIISNWLLLEAFGCYVLGKILEKRGWQKEAFSTLLILFSIAFPLTLFFSKIIKPFFGVSIFEGVGIGFVLFSSSIVLAPSAILHGASFPFACKLREREGSKSAGNVYFYEMVGTILGGGLLSFYLLKRFEVFSIAFGVCILNALFAFLLLPKKWSIKGLAKISLILIFSYLLLESEKIQRLSLTMQWKKEPFFHKDSIYANIVVLERGGEYTLFSNGAPIATVPFPDKVFVEEFAHFSLLSHKAPQHILIMGGGAGGLIYEVLKHPIKSIDYIELDPTLLFALKKIPVSLIKQEFLSEKVQFHHIDARLFLMKYKKKYDVIFLGFGLPTDLHINRFFTEEFFHLVSKRMKKEGILSLFLPGSLSYLPPSLRNLNASILNTLRSVFLYIRVIPGDINIYLASFAPLHVNEKIWEERIKERKISTSLLHLPYMEYRLQGRYLSWFNEALADAERTINKDFYPIALYHALNYWSALFSPSFQKLLSNLRNIPPLFLNVFIVSIILLFFRKFFKKRNLPFLILTTGFCAMLFSLLLFFSFQTLHGYIYYKISLLITTFMAGGAIGAKCATSLIGRYNEGHLLRALDGIIMCYPIILFFLLKNASAALFPLLCFFTGFLTGAQFPLAIAIYLGKKEKVARAAALLYGADLLGGWMGGVLGAIIFPAFGIFWTCTFLFSIKFLSFIFFKAFSA